MARQKQATDQEKESLRSALSQLLKEFSGQRNTLTIPRPYITLCGGDHLAALLLSQIVYWSDRTKDPEGWFAKSYEEWEDELCMTEYMVKRAISGDKRSKNKVTCLKDLGVEVKLKPSNFHHGAATLHYRINQEMLQNAVLNIVAFQTLSETPPPTMFRTPPPTMLGGTPQQCSELYTEPIAEPIAENINKTAEPDGGFIFSDLIKAWLNTTETVVAKPYANTTNRDLAEQLIKKKITPQDVANYIHYMDAVETWRSRKLKFPEVASGIVGWKKKQNPSPIPPQETVTPPPPPEQNTGEYITPEQVEEFNRMFADLVKSKSANIGVRPS